MYKGHRYIDYKSLDILALPVEYDYDRLKYAKKTKDKKYIKFVRDNQHKCCHCFGDIKEYEKIEYIHNPNNKKFISVLNFIISFLMSDPEYVRICKHCGKAEYFYALDEAETYPESGTPLFYLKKERR